LANSGISNSGFEKTFENFEVKNTNSFAFKHCVNWADCLGANREFKNGIFLYGPTGTGKTHLALAIAQRLIISYGLFTRVLTTYQIPRNDQDALIRLTDMGHNPVLVLDDMGAEKLTERAAECLFILVDARTQGECPMVITSNFSPDDLERKLDFSVPGYGKRVVSRLYEACDFLPVGGKDFRKKLARRRHQEIGEE
jgi:DNA replication protein DnaC